ncbi:flagellin, partial [Bacillus altitudinis]|uniref:flagellin N-terminal helical domain-containing protein n=1 Tax=Bacillus altitudinis TaxID=293387 RepID=UPI001BA71438
MRINHNIAALNTLNRLSANNGAGQKNMEKLSSGLRINRAGDDAAGLAISEKMRGQIRGLEMASKNAQDGISLIQTAEGALTETHAILQRLRELKVQRINRAGDDAAGLAISEKMRGQIRGLEMASKNAQDGISLIQTAEGALTETHAILQRMRELTVQAGNVGTQQTEDLTAIQDEIKALVEEIDGISSRTAFNGKNLLNGDVTDGFQFQIGANKEQHIIVEIGKMDAETLTVKDIDVSVDGFNFDTEIEKIDAAIGAVSKQRSSLGAVQNRLEHTINNLGASAENLTAAESRI